MFFRFINDVNVNWRCIIYSVFRQIYSRVSSKAKAKPNVKCIKTENIGKVQPLNSL